jgi:transposase
VLGASNYTYAEATRTQKKRDFVASTIRALEYIGGVPELVSASATAGASVAEASRAT